MTRRSNKSHKVPNAKLRPPPNKPNLRPYPSSDHSLLQSQQELDASFVDTCPRPFYGVVVSTTGISDKTSLFKQALELGAGHNHDFTDKVTHLIANDHGSLKYKCAVQMKIPIVRSSWITESHEIWLRGDDVNFEQSLAKHRLPIFSNIVLALSGIESTERRMRIQKLVTEENGTFVKSIERPVKVTHLLCSGDEVTEERMYAEKFNQRREADIKIVWEEWLWDSLNFGGRFDESEYLVDQPRPELRSSPHQQPSSPPAIHQHSSHPSPPESSLPLAQGPATDLEPEDELASAKRIPHVTLQLWENLLGSRGFEIVEGKLKRSPTKAKPLDDADDDIVLPVLKPPNAMEKGSKLLNFKRTNSFAPTNRESSTQEPQRRQPFCRAATAGPADFTLADPPPHFVQPVASDSTMDKRKTYLHGKKFRALGEARCLNVKTVIEQGGGWWTIEDDDDVDFIVVRLVSGSKFFRDEGDETERTKFRTECWLERCNCEERICSPDEHITFRPLPVQTPLRGADDINLSFSGLDESEACWMRRFVRAIGANLARNFSRRSTHLLCPSFTGAKYNKAKEWGISVIDMAWLSDAVNNGGFPSSSRSSAVRKESPMLNYVDNRGKGKGKEINDQEHVVANPSNGCQLPDEAENVVFRPSGNLLNNASQISFGHSSMFVGHSTPKLDPQHNKSPSLSEEQAHVLNYSESDFSAAINVEQIPSSASPSPMRVLGFPVRNPELNQETKRLQESIANLLGKRRASAEEIPEAAQRGRAAKRTRLMSKTKSSSKMETVDNDTFVYDAQGCNNGRVYSPVKIPENGRLKDDGMKVVYEDPKQREEKRRLMTLLGEVVPDEAGERALKRDGR